MKDGRFVQVALRTRVVQALRFLFWLPVLAVLALPAAQVKANIPGAPSMSLEAMPLGLGSTITFYRTPAQDRSAVPDALNRVKRFTYLIPHSRDTMWDNLATARCVPLVEGPAGVLRGQLRLTTRSPPR